MTFDLIEKKIEAGAISGEEGPEKQSKCSSREHTYLSYCLLVVIPIQLVVLPWHQVHVCVGVCMAERVSQYSFMMNILKYQLVASSLSKVG